MPIIPMSQILDDAKAGNAWPQGDYDVEIAQADSVLASTGSPMVKCQLRVLVGSYAGKTIKHNFVLSVDNPVALSIFIRAMKALGVDDSLMLSMQQVDTDDPNCLAPLAAMIRGKRCRIQLGHREWGGMTQNDVKAIRPITDGIGAGGPAGAPMPSAAAGPMAPPPPPPPPPVAAPPTAPPMAPPPPSVLPPASAPPQPTPQPPVEPQPVTTQAPTFSSQIAANLTDTPVVGYEAVWPMLNDEQKAAIRAQAGSVTPAVTVPSPPVMPV